MPAPSPVRSRLLVLLALALLAALPSAAQAPDRARAEADFDAAHALHVAGLFDASADAWARWRDAYPASPRAAEALLLHAEAALVAGDEALAQGLYTDFETRYAQHPLAPEARLALGRFHLAAGDYDRAAEAFEEALTRPAPPARAAEVAYLLGQTRLAQGRAHESAAAFARAAEGDTPTTPAALYALGTVRRALADDAGAAEAFGALAERYPDAPEDAASRLALAEALLRTGRLAEAADEAARRRPELTGDDAERAALLEGEARVQLGETDAALDALDAVPPESRYARRAALAAGRALFASERWDEAAERLALARADGAEDDDIAHEAAYYEGLARKRTGDLAAAAERLEAAATRRPGGVYADAATLELGVLRYERRDYAAAAAAFDRLARGAGPLAGEAARLLGEAYAAQGDAARAQEAYRLAEQRGSATAGTRSEVAFQEAFALHSAGRYDEAATALAAVYSADPAGARAGEALFWAGESAYQGGRFAQAETILSRFLAEFPDHPQTLSGRYVLAWTHFARRDYASAATAFEAFLTAYAGSTSTVPYTADALLRLGDSYYALGRFEDARAAYARVAAATPDARGADYALYQTAQTFEGQGRTADAAAAYARLASTYPSSDLLDEALVARGTLLVQDQPDAAVADFERVLAVRPTSPMAALAAVGIGDARYNQERYADAEAAYRLALDRYPASPAVADALAGLDYTLAALGREAEFPAAVASAEARATDPDARARIRVARARAALAAGDAAGAVTILDGATPTAAVAAEWRLAHAEALAAAGRPADAAAMLRRLLADTPSDPLAPEAALQLAEVLLVAGDAEGARAEAVRFQTSAPDDAERVAAAIAVEARALVALGRADEADARLRDLVARFPGTSAAREALRQRPDLGE